MKKSGSSGFYKFCFWLSRIFINLFFWVSATGRENIPEGATLVCGNHSGQIDPFLLAYVFGINTPIHVISKAELFRIPVISQVLTKLEMISLDRGTLDTNAIKKTFAYLSKGEKVVIFPEGTRTPGDKEAAAKGGAIKIAEHTKAPILPVYIPRKKRYFSSVKIVIGEPFYVEKQGAKRSQAEYAEMAEALMDTISALRPSKPSK